AAWASPRRLCYRRGCPPRSPLFPYTTLFRSGRGEPPVLRVRRLRRPAGHHAERRAGEVGRARELHVHAAGGPAAPVEHQLHEPRSEEHTSELQSRENLVCRLLLEKNNRHVTD